MTTGTSPDGEYDEMTHGFRDASTVEFNRDQAQIVITMPPAASGVGYYDLPHSVERDSSKASQFHESYIHPDHKAAQERHVKDIIYRGVIGALNDTIALAEQLKREIRTRFDTENAG